MRQPATPGRDRAACLVVVIALIAGLGVMANASDATPAAESDHAAQEPRTLEDIYGPTGDTFQGGIGFLTLEGTSEPDRSFGLAVDDVVLRWREFTLVEDATDCATGGSCASIDVDSVFQFTSSEVIEVSVLDDCPYGPDGVNNCNGDSVCSGTATSCSSDGDCAQGSCSASGAPCNAFYDCADPYAESCLGGSSCVPDFSDAEDDTDCDDDGVQDVIVRALIDTASDPDGAELVVLNNVPGSPALFSGEIAVSSTANSVGVLFVTPIGTDNPTVTFEYLDEDDCTGQVCRNSVDPRGWGLVDVDTLMLLQTCTLQLVRFELVGDNGDDDRFADANETVDVRLVMVNSCGIDLTGCSAVLTTGSPTVDCLLDSVIELGDIPVEHAVTSIDTGSFRIAGIARTDVNEILQAEFGVAVACDQFDALSVPLATVLDLDLDLATGGESPATYFEDFEGGLGDWSVNNLDAGIPPDVDNGEFDADGLARADGMRCQYNDPEWPNSNTFDTDQALDCYPGATLDTANAIYWTADGAGTGSPDGGRAYEGTKSLYFGVKLAPTHGFTLPMGMLEAVEMTQPINVGLIGSELSWFQQVDLLDSRSVNAPAGESTHRGVVQAQVVDGAGDPTAPWNKLEPYLNAYDQQATDNYSLCMFDSVDDGTTEDDFFDPTDPDRRFGPSSTCFPGFSFSYMGDTFLPFSPANLGNATMGPGYEGSLGTGTWVESRVDLSQYVGQRIKLRFLQSGLRLGITATVQQAFEDSNGSGWNPTPGDDGWWIDSLSVTNTFANPVPRTIDTNDNSSLEPCGAVCEQMTGVVTVSPPSGITSAPGQVVELDASESFADRCVDGVLQFRFSTPAGVVRGWSDDPLLLAAPNEATRYLVEVRCSSDPSCAASQSVPIAVNCPGGSTRTITALDPSTFGWDGSTLIVDRAVGSFTSSSDIGLYAATLTDAIGSGSSIDLSSTPAPGSGLWLLIKRDGALDGGEFCNGRTWRSGGVGERVESARDAALGD